jgi:hypothetical protein
VDPVTPNRALFLLPEGSREVVYAKDQPQYLPLPVLVTPDGKVASMWKPDASELALLNQGVPVCITCWTFNGPLQPLSVSVGGVDLR